MADTQTLLQNVENSMVEFLKETAINKAMDEVFPTIQEKIEKEYGFLPKVHEIKINDKPTVELNETLHEKFDEVLKIVSLDIPVFLTGAAGTGKNVICKQVAKSLGLDFYFTNAVSQEYKLTGFIDANGKYQETQFYKAFTQGGLFFLDEMDASIPEVLVILNAAIANRYFDFPNGKVEAHPDFRVIAAGNTNGLGADNAYTGRYCLDRASLDRFALVDIDYSLEIEKSLCNGNMELIDFVHAFRKACSEAGIDCLCSYRTIERISKLENVFNNLKEILNISLVKGLSDEDMKIICKRIIDTNRDLVNNKYLIELCKGIIELPETPTPIPASRTMKMKTENPYYGPDTYLTF